FDNPATPLPNPLTINLNKLNVNLNTLYKGGVDGNIQITGYALNPVISGQLQLANGQVSIPTSTNNTNSASSDSTNSVNLENTDSTNSENTNSASSSTNVAPTTEQNQQNKSQTANLNGRLNNLELTLGKNVEINLPPIISFRAAGTLDVDGPFTAPVPKGTIRLTGGGVNLFATQFNLARGSRQTATFTANRPRDPDLNINLVTNIVDAPPTQVRTSPLSSEINDPFITGFDPVTTIRVNARINGPASRLDQNLRLTSSPERSQAEIVAVLGGTFLQTLGGGTQSTLGLVNLASSTLNIQRTFTQIGNAIGLSDFRIFPTINPTNSNSKRNSSGGNSTNTGLDVAAEAGVNVARNFYLSAQKILTTNQPIQFGVNYRLTPNIRVRTSTDFTEDNNAQIEYQTRF
ncbi:translocation/assembly module TamB domain-containing protein, partial [Aetokthonos hydrillicola]